jgi:hypothetical protein
MHQSCLQCGAYPAKKDRSASRSVSSAGSTQSKSSVSTEKEESVVDNADISHNSSS